VLLQDLMVLSRRELEVQMPRRVDKPPKLFQVREGRRAKLEIPAGRDAFTPLGA
jgi:hypothetical protein